MVLRPIWRPSRLYEFWFFFTSFVGKLAIASSTSWWREVCYAVLFRGKLITICTVSADYLSTIYLVPLRLFFVSQVLRAPREDHRDEKPSEDRGLRVPFFGL